MESAPANTRALRSLRRFKAAQRKHRWYLSLREIAGFWLLFFLCVVLLPAYAAFFSQRLFHAPEIFFLLWACFLLLLPVILAVRGYRAGKRADAIIHYIHQGLHLDQPLPDWLALCRFGERGKIASRLLVLSEVLRQGTSLSEALKFGLPEMSASDLAMITQGEAAGSLPMALEGLELRRRSWKAEHQLDISYLFYLASGLLVTLFTMAALGHFAIPKLHRLEAPQKPMPPVLSILAGHYDFFKAAAFGLCIFLACVVTVWLRQILWPNYRGIPIMRWIRERLLYFTPIIRGVYRPGQWADATRCLAQGVRNGRTLPEVLQTAGEAGNGGVVAKKLSHWRHRIELGTALRPAAQAVGMPRLLCDVLDQPNAAALAAALEYVAGVYQQRNQQRAELLRSAMIPVAVLAFGLIVGLVDVSIWKMYTAIIAAFEHKGPY